MGKLNAKLIEHTKPRDKEYRLSDGDGLFLRVRPTGSKSWLFCFRLGGNRTWLQMPLGSVSDVSLKDARAQLNTLRKQVAEGIDPRVAKAAAKTKNIEAITMQALFDNWIGFVKLDDKYSDTWIKRHQNRWKIHLKSSLGNLLAKDITRAHLATPLDEMTRKKIKEETRKALTTLNLMLDYGLARQYIDQNHARILKPKDFSATAPKSRSRVLNIQELRELWKALDLACDLKRGSDATPSLMVVTATAIKLLIITGARRGEVAGMRWDEINFTEEVWILPENRTKNSLSHTIYLPKIAIQLIQSLHQITGHTEYVFNCQLADQHIHEDTLSKAIQRLRGIAKGKKKKILTESPLVDIPAFTVHDCRRSAATAWGEHLKTAPHVIERMLNHQPRNKLVATYQRAVYATEQKAAWSDWGKLIEHQIASEPANILLFKHV